MAKQPKIRVCKNCNNPFPEKAGVCPSCGTKNKKAIYKKWWFWLIVVLIVIRAASSGGTESDSSDNQPFSSISSEVKNAINSGTEVSSSKSDSTVNETTGLVNGMRPKFKKAMDSYEAFFDEYVAFMEKYAASDGSDLSLLTEYATYMRKYADMMADFEAWDSEKDMNTAEMVYYIEVHSRITQKLLLQVGE